MLSLFTFSILHISLFESLLFDLDEEDDLKMIEAPKSIERLEEISTERAIQRQLEEESDDERIQISTDLIDLRDFDELGSIPSNNDKVVLDGVEELY